MRKFILLVAFLALAILAQAQDIIITKDSERIEAQITEISDTQVKFKRLDNMDGPIFVLPGTNVASIVFANGEVFVFPQETTQPQEPQNVIVTKNEKTPSGIEYVPGLQLKRKKGEYYYGDDIITSQQYEVLIRDNCPEAYKKYRQADVSISIAASSGLVALTCLGVGLVYLSRDKTPPDVFLYGAAGGAVILPISFIIWNSKMNKSTELFNQHCANGNAKSTSYISFAASSSGIGLTINF